jgi:hypothetical protein
VAPITVIFLLALKPVALAALAGMRARTEETSAAVILTASE